MSPRFVARAHARGGVKDMQRLRASGVDGVFTPTPEAFLNSVGNLQSPLNDDADVTATGPNGQFILSKNPDDSNACQYNGPVVTGSFTVTVTSSSTSFGPTF